MKKIGQSIASFLVIILVAIVVIILMSNNEDAPSNKTQNDSITTSSISNTQSDTESKDAFLAGEKAICDYYGGEYAVSMQKATIGTKRNEFHDTQPERILIIDYSYENISSDTDVTFGFLYMRVYDGEGNLLETYPSIETKQSQGLVSKGHKTSASAAYSLNCASNEITIDVYNPIFDKFGTFKLTIEE